MIEIGFKARGIKESISWLKAVTPESDRKLVQALGEGALMIHGTAVKSIQAHESKGETYGKHTASKPGFPPNTDTGGLVKSIRWTLDSKKLEARVGTNLKYGAWLEYGTRNVEPRPWLRPAYLEHAKDIDKMVREAVKNAVKEAKK